MYTRTHRHTYIYIHTHTYIYTHTHTHTRRVCHEHPLHTESDQASLSPSVTALLLTWWQRPLLSGRAKVCVTWLIYVCDMTRIHMCHMAHSHVWHDPTHAPLAVVVTAAISLREDKGVTWLILPSDMTHSYGWHDSCTCVTWLSHTSDMAQHTQLSLIWRQRPSLIWRQRPSLIWRQRPSLSRTARVFMRTCDMHKSYVWHDPLHTNLADMVTEDLAVRESQGIYAHVWHAWIIRVYAYTHARTHTIAHTYSYVSPDSA